MTRSMCAPTPNRFVRGLFLGLVALAPACWDSPCAAGQAKGTPKATDDRTFWRFAPVHGSGYIRLLENGKWEEIGGWGKPNLMATWEEIGRTPEYVELYDPVRKYKTRLGAGKAWIALSRDGAYGPSPHGDWERPGAAPVEVRPPDTRKQKGKAPEPKQPATPPPPKPEEPDEATKALIGKLTDQLKARGDARRRADAAAELGGLGSKAHDASRALCEAGMDTSSRVAVAALDALEKVRPDLHKHLITLIVDKDTAKHEQALRALAQFRDEANPATPIVLAYLRRESAANKSAGRMTTACTRCLSAIAADDPTILTTLTNIVRQHPGTELASQCLYALSRLGEAQPDLRKKVYTTLVAALTTAARLEAIHGLARLGPDAKDALPLLQRLRFDGDENVRNAAVAAIAKIQGS